MGHNLCIIDDAFMQPAIACKLDLFTSYSGAGLAILLNQDDWNEDAVVRDLCRLVMADEDQEKQAKRWELRAFSNPEHFINAFNDEQYRSDIIIFDWEYNTANIDQIDYLKNILKESHAIVFIYSRQNIESIKVAIAEELPEYHERLKVIEKQVKKSYEELLNTITDKQKSNFAFKFGHAIRNITSKSLNHVLCELSNMDFDNVVRCLISQNTHRDTYTIDSELKQIIGAKIKDTLKESPELHSLLESKGITADAIKELLELTAECMMNGIAFADSFWHGAQGNSTAVTPLPYDKLWSYRLYYKPRQEDKMIRTGDIVKKQDESDSKLYFVLNGDCDLQRFWKNCGGQLVLVELVNIALCKEEIRMYSAQLGGLNAEAKRALNRITSLTNGEKLKPIGGAPILLPYIPLTGSHGDFLLFPLRIFSYSIPVPSDAETGSLAQMALTYTTAQQYERVCAVSEPFVGPLKWAILNQLYGWGSPDYPGELQNVLGKKVKDIFQ